MAVEMKTEWGIRYEDGVAGDFKTRREARDFLRDSADFAVTHGDGTPVVTGSVVKRSLRVEVGEWEKA